MTPVQDRPLLPDELVTRRLQEWGAWVAAGGRGAAGYPTKSVLHQSWTPPGDGLMPARAPAAVSDARERHLHALIARLSVKLSDVLVLSFVQRVPTAQQAQRLGCQEATVRARCAEARRQLRVWLARG